MCDPEDKFVIRLIMWQKDGLASENVNRSHVASIVSLTEHWTEISGTFMPRALVESNNYRHVSRKNRSGQ